MRKQKINFILIIFVTSLIAIFIPQQSLAGWAGIEVIRWGWLDDIPKWFRQFQNAMRFLNSDFAKNPFISFIILCVVLLFGIVIIGLIVEFITTSLRR